MTSLYPSNYQFIEQTTMFVADKEHLAEQAVHPGGCAEIGATFLIQFFDKPGVGLYITIGILLIITLMTCSTINTFFKTEKHKLSPWSLLGLLPAIVLLPLHYNINYNYAGTVSMLIVAIVIRLIFCFKRFTTRTILAIIALPFLYYICGPLEYYNHLLETPQIIYLPWILLVSVLGISYIVSKINILNAGNIWVRCTLAIIILAGSANFYNDMMTAYVNHDDEFFKYLNCQIRSQKWDNVVEACRKQNMSNTLFQNCGYMAWAEKGELEKHVGDYPASGFHGIVSGSNHTPYVSAMISDVYYSMGHISEAMRHAFEANEMYGGYSPRMLQMLVKTNIIFGYYDVAKKYINILSKSHYYDWAEEMRHFLYNDDAVMAHSELGQKRRCIIQDNRFSTIKGLDDDLKQIIAANPEHSITKDYLNALYILNQPLGLALPHQ